MSTVTVSRLITAVLLILLVAGCSQMPERPEPKPTADPDIARAADMVQRGQYAAAAQLYRELAARTADPAQRGRYLLQATEAAREVNDWDSVRAALSQLQVMVLDPNDTLQRRLLQAELLVHERNLPAALELLGTPPSETASRDLRIRYHRDLAATYRQMGNLLETANALQAVDALQTDRAARLETQTEILRSLALLNEQVLTQLQPSPPGIAGGWMELALLVKRHGSEPADLAPVMAEWRQRFPDHPALPELLQNYSSYLREQLLPADRIAVLLPETGRFAQVAAVIRDGIMASRFQQATTQLPEIRFYDSSNPEDVWPLYDRAVADGAELVIGPLQKEAVSQLLRAGSLGVPVLALNQVPLETAPPYNLFMYSLSPEDEARQAAEKIWLDGGRRPSILTPQGDWGDRITQAFEQRWTELGGELAGVGRYDGGSHDYSATITRMLLIDDSNERRQQVQRWLGRSVEFEPRRRDDTDAIFIAARPVQAQGLRPQLQFHHAADLPIYATSHAWSGSLTPDQVIDMRGIMLPDVPWLVPAADTVDPARELIAAELPQSQSAYARLFAMGMDAFRLAPHLNRLQSSRYESLDGSTGNLYMDELNQVHRQLVWVALDEQPRVLGFAPRLDLQRPGGVELTPEATVAGDRPAG